MLRKRTPILVTAAALVAGAGVGAGTYAVAGGGSKTTTTVVQQAPATGSPAAATKSTSVGDVYKQNGPGVVEITVTESSSSSSGSPFPFGGGGNNGSQKTQAQGSGFVYDLDGHVITNDHVVSGASSISVTFADGSKYNASVVGTDPSTDLAVVKVDVPSSKLHPLSLGDSSNLQVGDGVVAIGSPFGLEETVTSGIVSALDRSISSANSFTIAGAIQTDAAINHGNSGGPLLNLSGQVVGITTQIESESGGNDGVGFAVPSNTIHSVVSQLVTGKTVEHAYLGVYVGDATNSAGAKIARVRSGSPADDAGLKVGDVVTEFGGHTIHSANDLTGAVSAHQPGDKVSVTYQRGGSTKTADLTLANRPS
jgi:putative serine protease PepD